MISILILILFFLDRKTFSELHLMRTRVDLEKEIIKTEKGDLDLPLTKKKLHSLYNNIEVLVDSDKQHGQRKQTSKTKNLLYKINLYLIKKNIGNLPVLKHYFISDFLIFKLFLAVYFVLAYNMRPSTGDISGIKEINGKYFFYERNCNTEGVGLSGQIERDCWDNTFGEALTAPEIEQYYEIKEKAVSYHKKYFSFLIPPFNFLPIIEVYYMLFVVILIFYFRSNRKSKLSDAIKKPFQKPDLFIDNYVIFQRLIYYDNKKLFYRQEYDRYRMYDDQDSLFINILTLRYLSRNLNDEENYYFETYLQLLAKESTQEQYSIDDELDYYKYYHTNRNYAYKLKKKNDNIIWSFALIAGLVIGLYLVSIGYYWIAGIIVFILKFLYDVIKEIKSFYSD